MTNEMNTGMETQDTLEQLKAITAEIKETLNGPLPAGGNLLGKVDVNALPQTLENLMIKWTDLQAKLEEVRKAVMDPGLAAFDQKYRYQVPFLRGKQEDVPQGEVSCTIHADGRYPIDRIFFIANDSENDVKIQFDCYNWEYGTYPNTADIILHPGETLSDIDVKLHDIYVNTKDTNAKGDSRIRFLYRCFIDPIHY